jgi:hypothetical protein
MDGTGFRCCAVRFRGLPLTRLLPDTHAFLGWVDDAPTLSARGLYSTATDSTQTISHAPSPVSLRVSDVFQRKPFGPRTSTR